MKKSRFTTEQIIGFIKQADAGMAVAELARQNGFSPASFYAWRAKYGGMEPEHAKRLKELESENGRLKRLLAEARLPHCRRRSAGFWKAVRRRWCSPSARPRCMWPGISSAPVSKPPTPWACARCWSGRAQRTPPPRTTRAV